MELGTVDVLLGRLSCNDQVEDRYVMIGIGQLDAISKRASKIPSAAENVERLHRCERLRKDIEVKALHDLVVLLKQEKQASELWISIGYFWQPISTPLKESKLRPWFWFCASCRKGSFPPHLAFVPVVDWKCWLAWEI